MSHLAAIVVLLALNGFFVAAEFALVKARRLPRENLAGESRTAAKLTLRIQANLEAYLAACRLGITMASLGLGWVGEPFVAALLKPMFVAIGVPEIALHSVAFLLGFLLFASLHIVIGEQVPKTFAIRRAEQASTWVAYPLHYAYLLMWPLNWLLNNASRRISSLFNAQAATHGDVLANDGITNTGSSAEDHVSLKPNEAAMLNHLREFDQRGVGRVMIPRKLVKVLDLAVSPEANQRVVMQCGYSRFPLIDSSDNDALLGIVLVKVVFRAMINQDITPWQRLNEYCQTPPIVLEKYSIVHLFELMLARRVHVALVASEYGSLRGIVTLEDLLQEIVGNRDAESRGKGPASPLGQLS